MIKSRTAQLIYQSFFCAIGLVGIIASFGFFDMTWRWDFYIHFTNLSNYLCIGIMFAELVQTARKKEDSFVSTAPVLKFIGILGILLTFLVLTFFSQAKLPVIQPSTIKSTASPSMLFFPYYT